MFSSTVTKWVLSVAPRPAPDTPDLASITTSAIRPARASGRQPEDGGGGIAAGVGDELAPAICSR